MCLTSSSLSCMATLQGSPQTVASPKTSSTSSTSGKETLPSLSLSFTYSHSPLFLLLPLSLSPFPLLLFPSLSPLLFTPPPLSSLISLSLPLYIPPPIHSPLPPPPPPSLTKDVETRSKYDTLVIHPFIKRIEQTEVDVAAWYGDIHDKEAALA